MGLLFGGAGGRSGSGSERLPGGMVTPGSIGWERDGTSKSARFAGGSRSFARAHRRFSASGLAATWARYSARSWSWTIHTQNLHCGALWQQSSGPGSGGLVGGLSSHAQKRRWHASQMGGGGGRSSWRPTREPSPRSGPPVPVQARRAPECEDVRRCPRMSTRVPPNDEGGDARASDVPSWRHDSDGTRGVRRETRSAASAPRMSRVAMRPYAFRGRATECASDVSRRRVPRAGVRGR